MTAILQRWGRMLIPRSVRNWLRSPARSLSWWTGVLRFKLGDRPEVELLPQWTVRCHPNAFKFAYQITLSDPEQVRELSTFIRFAEPSMALFDLGAHFGLFSLAAAKAGGQGTRIVAVDPSAVAARMMETQFDLNAVSDQVVLIRAAIGHESGRHRMVDTGVLSGGYYLTLVDERPASEYVDVDALSIDDLVQQTAIVPTHVKIDVEGHEFSALEGGRETLNTSPGPLLFVELHNHMVQDMGGDPRQSLDRIRQLGFHIFDDSFGTLSDDAILQQAVCRVICAKPNRHRMLIA